MSDELLSRATHALRAATKPHRDGMDEMLARVSRRRPVVSGPHPRIRAVAFALAATFAGVGAWARVTGRLDAILGPADSPRQPPTVSPASPPVGGSPHTSRDPRSAALPEAAPVADAVALPTSSMPAAEPHRSVPKRARIALPSNSAKSSPQPIASTSTTPSLEQLYREAHRAHFGGADANQAVAAWDRYLAVAGPEARLLIEARYNRATALARAGRVSEAVSALRPFAEGAYGNYRREEARALSESLSAHVR